MSWYLLSGSNLQKEMFPEAHTANQTIPKNKYILYFIKNIEHAIVFNIDNNKNCFLSIKSSY